MQVIPFPGLDVHKATVPVAVAGGERGGEVRARGTIPTGRSYRQARREAQQDSPAPVVEAVQAMRGVAFIVAVTVVAEVAASAASAIRAS